MKSKEKTDKKKGKRNKLVNGKIRKATGEVLSARKRRRIELSRQRNEQQKERAKNKNELDDEEERVRIEREEARKMEVQQELLEKEEKEAERKVEERRQRLRRRWELREIERVAELEKEMEKQKAIDRLKEELRKEEESLRAIRETSAAREKELDEERNELQLVKALAAATKAARIEATRKADEHPHSLSLLYSRSCSICLSSNPRRRAVMIACGHMTCALCAEQLGDENAKKEFPCPLCRNLTTYVKTFEEVESHKTRKRKMCGDDEATSMKSPRVANPSVLTDFYEKGK